MRWNEPKSVHVRRIPLESFEPDAVSQEKRTILTDVGDSGFPLTASCGMAPARAAEQRANTVTTFARSIIASTGSRLGLLPAVSCRFLKRPRKASRYSPVGKGEGLTPRREEDFKFHERARPASDARRLRTRRSILLYRDNRTLEPRAVIAAGSRPSPAD